MPPLIKEHFLSKIAPRSNVSGVRKLFPEKAPGAHHENLSTYHASGVNNSENSQLIRSVLRFNLERFITGNVYVESSVDKTFLLEGRVVSSIIKDEK